MRLFIRMVDGAPFEHPIIESNMRAAFPKVDLDNLPPQFMPFERVPRPKPEPGKIIVSAQCRYEVQDGVVRDVWDVVQEDVVQEDAPLE